MKNKIKPALPPQVIDAVTKPPTVPDLLVEKTLPQAPPPKSDERLLVEEIAKELGISSVRDVWLDGKDTVVNRDTVIILGDCQQAIRKLQRLHKEDKQVGEAIDTLLRRFVPFYGRGPSRWGWMESRG